MIYDDWKYIYIQLFEVLASAFEKIGFGIVSAKRDLVHIIKFVIKMPYV